MSRFSILKKHLSFVEAVSFYLKMRTGNWNNFNLKKLKHNFSIRNNPFDFATLEEVILKEEYNLSVNFNPSTIIDGGANIGLTSVFFANKYPKAEIVAVEPEEGNFEMLRRNTKKYENVRLIRAGIWSHSAILSVVDEGKGNNSFTVSEILSPKPGSINAISIYDIMQQRNWETIDILKLDIEGAEKNVFESDYEQWLPKVKVLIVELHDRMRSGCTETVFKAVSQYNFSNEIKGENHIFFNKDF
ncbi:MAG TPA: FkbM family methyltransferase [Chitinophagaceae bacterium]|nr:FkbM family methyltransferase [Chitinophagaceae bacterium]